MAQGESLKSVARSHGVQPVQIRNWVKVRERLSLSKPKARSIAKGRPSSIKHLEEQIIGWALDMRYLGVGLSFRHLQLKACRADLVFRQKTKTAQYQMIRRLCASNCVVRRRKTHVSQEQVEAAKERATTWLTDTRLTLSVPEVNKTYVLNMDQTPVPFTLASNTTLNLSGERTITIRQTGKEKTRCTVSLTVSADGDKLKPMVIFKGERDGRIVQREFPTNPFRQHLALACQPNAWQDEANLLQWVDAVLVPHLQQRAAGTGVHLFLDQFSAHDTPTFRARMVQLGVTLRLIPGGCTWLLQPVDVGIGKPFKDRLRDNWWNWMIEGAEGGFDLAPPSREDVSRWVYETWEAMPRDIIRRSWLKSDLPWFVQE
jgi:transposase-like protein